MLRAHPPLCAVYLLKLVPSFGFDQWPPLSVVLTCSFHSSISHDLVTSGGLGGAGRQYKSCVDLSHVSHCSHISRQAVATCCLSVSEIDWWVPGPFIYSSSSIFYLMSLIAFDDHGPDQTFLMGVRGDFAPFSQYLF